LADFVFSFVLPFLFLSDFLYGLSVSSSADQITLAELSLLYLSLYTESFITQARIVLRRDTATFDRAELMSFLSPEPATFLL